MQKGRSVTWFGQYGRTADGGIMEQYGLLAHVAESPATCGVAAVAADLFRGSTEMKDALAEVTSSPLLKDLLDRTEQAISANLSGARPHLEHLAALMLCGGARAGLKQAEEMGWNPELCLACGMEYSAQVAVTPNTDKDSEHGSES